MNILSGGTIPDPAAYWEGRLSNGPVAAEVYGMRPEVGSFTLSPSEAGGGGYAIDRARTGAHELGNEYSGLGQVSRYLASGQFDPGAQHLVWIGANNLRDALMDDPAHAPAHVMGALGDIQTMLSQLVGAGAQHVLVPNAPNLGLVPGVLGFGPEAAAGATALSAQFNAGLEQILAAFDPVANVYRFDTFGWMNEVVADPILWDLKNVHGPLAEPLLPTPDADLFWDSIHFTARAHAILGNLWPVIPEPHTMGLVIWGIGLAGAMRRRT
jgi:phospholipase/lecithinase/hemolysin